MPRNDNSDSVGYGRRAVNAEAAQFLATLIAERITKGERRPLTPEALLREHLSAFTDVMGLRNFPLQQHRRLARAVFKRLVAAGAARPVAPRRDMSEVRAALRARVDSMPPADPNVSQHTLGWVPDDDEEEGT